MSDTMSDTMSEYEFNNVDWPELDDFDSDFDDGYYDDGTDRNYYFMYHEFSYNTVLDNINYFRYNITAEDFADKYVIQRATREEYRTFKNKYDLCVELKKRKTYRRCMNRVLDELKYHPLALRNILSEHGEAAFELLGY